MKRKRFSGFVTACALFFTIILSYTGVLAAEFTADIVITGPGGDYTFMLYVRDNMYRLQKTKGPSNVPPFPTIVNRDTAMTWGLNPQMRQYVEIADIDKTIMLNPLVGWTAARKNFTENAGPGETLNGYDCKTWIYTETGKAEPAAKVWFSEKLNHILREERFGLNKNPVLELQNIQEGPLDPALFEIPVGYTEVDMGGSPGPKPMAAGAKKIASAANSKPRALSSPPSSTDQDTAKSDSAAASSGNLIFILDASGSMWGKVEGKAKIAIAKEVLTGLIKELPDDAVVGLVAYGHRRKGDCNDVEELVPLGKIDKNKLISTVQALSPKGKTPISRSVRKTAERIKHLEDETTIILVSDGKETCDPDPCGLVKELKEAGIRFVMHVIGFDVTEEEKAQLECMAQAGGGEYFTAKTAKDFQMAAKEVVKKASEKPPVSLLVTCIKDEKPIRAYVKILTKGGEKHVAESWTGTEKPALFRLPPGMYDIRAQDQSVIQRPTVDIREVEIIEGQKTERVVIFSTEGVLHVKAVKNNAPAKTYVKVHRQEDSKYMRDGWTREDGTPAEFKLLPGVYKVSLQDQSVTQRPVIWIENVEVQPGETVERIATFGAGGVLHVKAVKNNAPAKTYVKVHRQEDSKYMRDGWTREDGTP
ncbi:MAG: VWA domain-containing protein, partial [Thermodesulfobacteriota bacterium]|nr:VWA domain-containing protein [Thermodesulfobacteriota bacterium]